MTQAVVDTRALEIATAAKALIDAHITDCSETRREMLTKFAEIKADIVASVVSAEAGRGKIYGLLWSAVIGIILTLLSIIAYFLVHVGLPGSH